jgi:hypothetical protein
MDIKSYNFLMYAAILFQVPCSQIFYYNDTTKAFIFILLGVETHWTYIHFGQAAGTEVEIK